MLFTLGIDSQFGTMQGVVQCIVDLKLFPNVRKEILTGHTIINYKLKTRLPYCSFTGQTKINTKLKTRLWRKTGKNLVAGSWSNNVLNLKGDWDKILSMKLVMFAYFWELLAYPCISMFIEIENCCFRRFHHLKLVFFRRGQNVEFHFVKNSKQNHIVKTILKNTYGGSLHR